MIADINLFGMFIDVALATALLAAVVLGVLHRLLAAAGGYRWIWHPPLFNLALFAVLWLALASAAAQFQYSLGHLLG
ncbi:DUF1656 domain-containing protein [Variovorax sp. OV329]|uniref:DUF1656 domain-containing protein n=1 Tax=Variovorax sp. OV329 TaxID=1882825 RepID=UPI0008EB9DBE|nr:DUF1656 domain-containing protein [Variovorax sp. OV329]SFM20448.1 Protein of unknown function [Variovorax sp. OV329]